jgi:hypothetical protein
MGHPAFVGEQSKKVTTSQDDDPVGEPKEKPQVPPLRYPGFSVEVGGAGELHAAFFTESRTRGRVPCCVAENPGSLRAG